MKKSEIYSTIDEIQTVIEQKELVTQEEYDVVVRFRPDLAAKYLNKVQGGWLNINVYSEHEHDKRQFKMETS